MKTKQKIYLRIVPVLVAIVGFGALGAVTFPGVVSAWCKENAGFNDRCVAENYDSIPDKRGVSEQEYVEMARSCTSGNPSGVDFGAVDEGSCINAAAACIQKSVRLDKCTADNLATIAMDGDCANGETHSRGDRCARLKEMNESAMREAREDAERKAMESCTTSGNSQSQYDQREACKKAITDACQASNASYDSGKRFNEYGHDEYKDCLDKALLDSSKTEQECTARGGVWTPASRTKDAECKPKPDPANKKTCRRQDGTTVEVDASEDCPTGTTQDNAPPTRSSNPNGMDCETDGSAKVQTSIIPCQGKGEEGIGNLLKFFVQIMSVGVGILAVGGILYGALMYASAQDNAAQTKKAVEIITNTAIGLLLYMFMIALINWLIPGSVIS